MRRLMRRPRHAVAQHRARPGRRFVEFLRDLGEIGSRFATTPRRNVAGRSVEPSPRAAQDFDPRLLRVGGRITGDRAKKEGPDPGPSVCRAAQRSPCPRLRLRYGYGIPPPRRFFSWPPSAANINRVAGALVNRVLPAVVVRYAGTPGALPQTTMQLLSH